MAKHISDACIPYVEEEEDERYGIARAEDDRAIDWMRTWVAIWRSGADDREVQLDKSMNACLQTCSHAICPSGCYVERRNGVKSLLVRHMCAWAKTYRNTHPIVDARTASASSTVSSASCVEAEEENGACKKTRNAQWLIGEPGVWGDGPPDIHWTDGDKVIELCCEFLVAQHAGHFSATHELLQRYVPLHAHIYKNMHIADVGAPYVVMQYLTDNHYIHSKYGMAESVLGSRLHPSFHRTLSFVVELASSDDAGAAAAAAVVDLQSALPFDASQWREVTSVIGFKAKSKRVRLTCTTRNTKNGDRMCLCAMPREQRSFRVDALLDTYETVSANVAVKVRVQLHLHSIVFPHLDEFIESFVTFERRSVMSAH